MSVACSECSSQFEITPQESVLREKLAPRIAGQKYALPVPKRCPECRLQRRIAFRNDQHYYRNTCVQCQKSLISIYSEPSKIPVLCETCFWGDTWNPLSYGKVFDFDKPFFKQYGEMRAKVPRLAIFNTQSENSAYTVHSSKNRNCYIGSSLIDCDECLYSDFLINCRDCVDCFSCYGMELCANCTNSGDCHSSDYLDVCHHLVDSYLCFDCRSSHWLVGCVGKRATENMILNEPATRDACRAIIERLNTDLSFRATFIAQFEKLKLITPKRDAWIINSEDVTGNYITNCNHVFDSYNARFYEDACYIYECSRGSDCMDTMRMSGCELVYDSTGIVDLKMSAFCNLTYQSDNLLYCDNCQAGTTNCFGCMSLKKEEYCILNRKYSKDEYEKIVPKVIAHMQKTGEWGEFFPPSLSPFGYNQTKAFDWFPLTQAEVVKKGWNWSDYQSPLPEGLKIVEASDLPETIAQVTDDILGVAISCDATKRPYRIVAPELAFYRKKGIPLPRLSPPERHRRRVSSQTRKLWKRFCEKCGSGISTTFAPDQPDIVYCETCYLSQYQ